MPQVVRRLDGANAGVHVFPRLVVQAVLDRLRDGQAQGHHPDRDDELDDPRQLGDGVRQKGVANGDVPLDGEGRYGEHRGVGRRLRREALQHAEDLAEDVYLRRPQLVRLRGQPGDQQQQVRYGQAEQVEVGRRVHGLIAGNHDARADVAHESGEEDDGVDHGDRYHPFYGVEDVLDGFLVGGLVAVQERHQGVVDFRDVLEASKCQRQIHRAHSRAGIIKLTQIAACCNSQSSIVADELRDVLQSDPARLCGQSA